MDMTTKKKGDLRNHSRTSRYLICSFVPEISICIFSELFSYNSILHLLKISNNLIFTLKKGKKKLPKPKQLATSFSWWKDCFVVVFLTKQFSLFKFFLETLFSLDLQYMNFLEVLAIKHSYHLPIFSNFMQYAD